MWKVKLIDIETMVNFTIGETNNCLLLSIISTIMFLYLPLIGSFIASPDDTTSSMISCLTGYVSRGFPVFV